MGLRHGEERKLEKQISAQEGKGLDAYRFANQKSNHDWEEPEVEEPPAKKKKTTDKATKGPSPSSSLTFLVIILPSTIILDTNNNYIVPQDPQILLKLTVAQLQILLANKKLKKTGTKAEIVQRLCPSYIPPEPTKKRPLPNPKPL